MAAMTLIEEALERNVVVSDQDADAHFENDEDVDINMIGENDDAFAANNQLLDGVVASRAEYDEDASGEDDEQYILEKNGLSQEAADGDIDMPPQNGDAEDEDDAVVDNELGVARADGVADDEEDGDSEDGSSGEDEDEDGVEGVGAVKIKPGLENDDDEESDSSRDNESEDGSDAESEVEAEWQAGAEAGEEMLPENDNPSRCIFCQKDEDDVPGEDFEEYLACSVCGDNAHQQCARDNHKIGADQDIKTWRCPDCVGNSLEPEIAMPSGGDANAALLEKYSSAPKIARDLLPPQKGTVKPGSHSVFNHLIVDDDPMDGSRTLRKRKTSSAEAEDLTSIRNKRRKNTSSGSAHTVGAGGKTEVLTEEIASEVDKVIDDVEAKDEEAPDTQTQPTRKLRIKLIAPLPPVAIIKQTRKNLIIRLRLSSGTLSSILSHSPKPHKKEKRSSIVARSRTSGSVAPSYHPSYSHTFYSFHDKDNEEIKSKPYGGILKIEEAQSNERFPATRDRKVSDDGRQRAEDAWKEKQLAALADLEPVKKPRKVSGPASQIECINFGGVEVDTWYAAPYPEEYSRNRVLYICEFCLKYMSSDYVAWRHKMKCGVKHPPGDEIYKEGSVSVHEVDGRKNPVYCQNLCLLAKLFLGSKTLYYDVEPFLFYVMTEYDINGCHFVGYFSKEKRPSSQNNVSCILTLPIHQRKGYGNLLIDFSYLLTRVEKKSGSPEKPLSDMGLVSYRNYWRLVLAYQLRNQKEKLSIIDISDNTGMTADDIVSGLEGLRALVRDPVTGTYAVRLDHHFFDQYIEKWEAKNYVKLNEKCLVWTPFVMGRQQASMIEHNPMSTVAPREEEEEIVPDENGKPIVVNGNGMLRDGLPNGIIGMTNGVRALSTEEALATPKIEPADIEMQDTCLATDNLEGQDTIVPPVSGSSDSSPKPPGLQATETNGHTELADTSAPTAGSEDIPPTRFEIWPVVKDARRTRPTLNRNPTSLARSRTLTARKSASRRRSTGASVRRSVARQQSSHRRRTGGTGRGPGRWPKGTKKSDFGFADSGPGLPPKLDLKHKTGNDEGDDDVFDEIDVAAEEEGEEGEEEGEEDDEDEEEDEDAILYETPGRKRAGISRPRRSIATGKGKGIAKILPESEDEDVAMDDADFVTGDIEGTDEDEEDEAIEEDDED